MRILPPLFCVLLLVSGVSGVEMKKMTLSVMKGDTVTLKPDDAEIPTNEQILWKFEGSIIVNMKNLKDGNFSTFDFADRIIKEKLLLDNQTGSLTITDLTTDNTGLYQLEIKSPIVISKNYSVTVHDVVESVSVMEGDTVTLLTGVKVKGDDQILWKFGDQVTIVADLSGAVDGSWSNIHLNDQTGELTISNIRRDQTGVYKLEFDTSDMILHRKFCIDISDAVKTVSVMEGESTTVPTGIIEIQGYDLILWKFKDNSVAEINKGTNQFLVYDSGDVRFKGRLKLNEKSGSLIISNSKTTDSGDYHLNMSSSSHTLQRTISVTVSESGLSPGAVAGIVIVAVAVFVLLVAAVVTVYHRCNL